MVAIAEARGVSGAQVALAWTSGRPGIPSPVIGRRTEAHLSDKLGAADLALSQQERKTLDEISPPRVLYPYWHQLTTASDRLGVADLVLLAPHLRGKAGLRPTGANLRLDPMRTRVILRVDAGTIAPHTRHHL